MSLQLFQICRHKWVAVSCELILAQFSLYMLQNTYNSEKKSILLTPLYKLGKRGCRGVRNLLTVVKLVCCGIRPLSEGLQSFCPSCSSITTRGYHEGKDSVPFFSVVHVHLRIWALTIIIKRLNSQRTYYMSGSLLNSLYRLSHLILSKRPHEVHSIAIANWQTMLSSLLPTGSFKPKQSGSRVHSKVASKDCRSGAQMVQRTFPLKSRYVRGQAKWIESMAAAVREFGVKAMIGLIRCLWQQNFQNNGELPGESFLQVGLSQVDLSSLQKGSCFLFTLFIMNWPSFLCRLAQLLRIHGIIFSILRSSWGVCGWCDQWFEPFTEF